MFDVAKIQTGLRGLVGVRQPLDPAYAIFDATNLASSSGRYLDDVSNFKAEFFIDTVDYASASNLQINSYLRQIQDSAINSVCSAVFGDSSHIDRNLLYTQARTRVNVETGIVNGFVGWKITPNAEKNVAFKITKVRCEFQGTGNLKLVLFNSAVVAPIFEDTVAISGPFHIFPLDWVVNNTDDDYKGDYYFGYEYDGTLIPFKRDYENSDFQNDISMLDIEKVYAVGGNDTALFDLNLGKYLSEDTGLNPDITVYEDYSDLILQNADLFAHAIQLQWAIMVMQRYISSTRSNRNERMGKDVILRTIQTIEGSSSLSPVRVTGLNKLLGQELESLSAAIKDLQKGYFGDGIMVQTLS